VQGLDWLFGLLVFRPLHYWILPEQLVLTQQEANLI
jgi:hypothetical protein